MIKKRTAAILSAVLIFSLLIVGCSPEGNLSSGVGAKEYPVTVGSVTIKAEPSGSAVLSPNAADIILALGYELTLKAKAADCTQSDLAALPNVTANDAAKIKGLGANLVFTDSQLSKEQQSAMQDNGITVFVVPSASSRSGLLSLYSQIGSVLKGAVTGNTRGQKIANGLFETIDDITRSIPHSNTAVTAVYLYDEKGAAATGDTVAGNLVKAAGFQNVAEDATNGKYSIDTLLLANPAYVFCAKGVKSKIISSEKLKNLNAVKQGHIYEMDPALMKFQGETMIDSVSFMAGTAYPQLLQSTSSVSGSSTVSSTSSSAVSPNGFNLNQTLKYGMQNDDVLKMQNRLQELGYMFVKPTGLYAEGTQQSVKDFQYLNDMTVTGVADPATLQKIFSSNAKKRS